MERASISAVDQRPFTLSIGTTEPWAAAGIQLDVFIADRLNVRIANCILAVSAQDGHGSFALAPLPIEIVEAQLASLHECAFAAVRIGAIPTPAHVDAICDFLSRRNVPTIFDPAITTSSGGKLIDNQTLAAIREKLFPLVTLLTPNLDESEVLLNREVRTLAQMAYAAQQLTRLGPQATLIKGGHLKDAAVDVLWDGEKIRNFESPRFTRDMRGTGCTLAMSITAALAHGVTLLEAIETARIAVLTFIQTAREIHGMRIVR